MIDTLPAMQHRWRMQQYGKPLAAAPRSIFFALSVVIFFLLLSVFDSIGFVPYYIDGTEPTQHDAASMPAPIDPGVNVVTELSQLSPNTVLLDSNGHLLSSAIAASSSVPKGKAPARISIPAISLDLAVQNPTTTDINALDALLVNGPARYADSAGLGEKGNMIIFAHSSHLPIVHNKMFQAFNKIPDLKAGDTITLTAADGARYLYSVNSVTKADVNDNVEISLATDTTKLTLVTCDTLTGKSARYVLDASFVGESTI